MTTKSDDPEDLTRRPAEAGDTDEAGKAGDTPGEVRGDDVPADPAERQEQAQTPPAAGEEAAPPQTEPAQETDAGQQQAPESAMAQAAGPARRRGGGGLAWLALAIGALALAGVAWLGWQERTERADAAENARAIAALETALARRAEEAESSRRGLEERLAELDAGLERRGERTEALEMRLQGRLEALREQNENLAPRVAGLEETMAALSGVSAELRDNWLLAEAEYYLQIGNRELELAGNPDIAHAALRFADERLRLVSDPGLSATRRALASELQSLEALDRVDIEGMTHSLAGLAERVETLPLAGGVAEAPAREAEAPEGSGGARALAALRRAFGSLVSVRRSEERMQPLLPPEATFFLRANLALKLQTARLALLRGEAAVFERSLDDAAAWIGHYFDADDRGVSRTLETLHELRDSGEVLAAPRPDVSESLRLLRSFRARRGAGGQTSQ